MNLISIVDPANGQRFCVVAGLFLLLLLVSMVALSPARLLYDEPYHLSLAENVRTMGWPAGLTYMENKSAAGPLYSALHNALGAVTHYSAPAIRWLNVALLLVTIALLSVRYSAAVQAAWTPAVGLSVLSVPFLWPASGMALTEVPALAAFSGFVLGMNRLLDPEPAAVGRIGPTSWAFVAGVCWGVAILGRQTYLVALPAVGLMFFLAPRQWKALVICLVSALVVSLWLFLTWGGLVPPSHARLDGTIRIDHGIFSLAYVAAATAFLRPSWILPKSVIAAVGAVVLGAGLTVLFRDYNDPPAKILLVRTIGEPLGLAVGFAIFVCMTSFGLVWLWNTLVALWQRRTDPFQVFAIVALLALVVSPAKISHLFSSRYVVGLLGILIVVVQPVITPWLAARMVMGGLFGAWTLYFYYNP